MDLLIATRSAHKMAEIREILGDLQGLRVLDLEQAGVGYSEAEDDLEPYETFKENAVSKMEYFHGISGLATVADDSGIEVDAIDGAPGVRSKRFAPDQGLDGEARDRANNEYLLELLGEKTMEQRTARYVCVAALALDGKDVMTLRGEASGVITRHPKGEGGFGYDPLFFDAELGRTFGEIALNEKQVRSHRGRAFRALAEHLTGIIRGETRANA